MRLLLDTHALLWWWADDAQLSAAARSAIGDRANEVLVSAASAWEIATKQRLGRLSMVAADGAAFERMVSADGFEMLPVTAAHAWRAGALTHVHRDPFDRMLAAQSELEAMTLLTRDPVFATLGLGITLHW
ncbi:MAG: type II toxin-antitoxin system VapC family toxin [Pseudomonadota bacterium]|jgi:PIN domain nuclease of toxin-antitoxin system|nr:type II toxin-antitoxin system VapC family toxin [Rubrivivax sp.]MCA3257923.1 type II toxin-antitoxin system VapC family toxin [Rubrivivax sp.]MCZ8031964.1 type II toxin-antitoxin system VapC family toxin [Rubrivivax sp.]